MRMCRNKAVARSYETLGEDEDTVWPEHRIENNDATSTNTHRILALLQATTRPPTTRPTAPKTTATAPAYPPPMFAAVAAPEWWVAAYEAEELDTDAMDLVDAVDWLETLETL